MKAKRVSKAQRFNIITTLPQAIIETILCLLPIEEAASTSILSREWRYKWTTIPKVKFHLFEVKQPSDGSPISDLESARKKEMRRKLIYAIHQVLLRRQGPIQEFILSMLADDTCFELDQILLQLSRNHAVKKLRFALYDYSHYGLPLSFFSLHHLTNLYLLNCDIHHKPVFNGFGSLTSLTLISVKISGKALLHLLSNCPSLKSLWLPSIMELFKSLPKIEDLTTWDSIIRPLVQASVPQELPTSLIHLKCYDIHQMFIVDGYGLTFLAVLTKCSPNLEKIKVQIGAYAHEKESDKSEEYSNILKEYSDVWLEHLIELEITIVTDSKPELEFAKFIMARSPNLKKVKLVTVMYDKKQGLEVFNVLLRAPCASPVNVVVLEYH